MFTNPRRQTFMTKVTNDHPKLQRAKAATELDAVIRSAAHLVLFRRAQIFRHQRKGAAQQIKMPLRLSSSIASARAFASMRNSLSEGIFRSDFWPRPSVMIPLSIEECACSEA